MRQQRNCGQANASAEPAVLTCKFINVVAFKASVLPEVGFVKSLRYYLPLVLSVAGFFGALGAIQIAILLRAYDAEADRALQPYVDGAPVPIVSQKIDLRPQSITIPALNSTSPGLPKGDRAKTETP